MTDTTSIADKFLDEPEIIINGERLSMGQSMSVRVAVELYMLQLQDPEFMKDIGPVGKNYLARLLEVRALMSKRD